MTTNIKFKEEKAYSYLSNLNIHLDKENVIRIMCVDRGEWLGSNMFKNVEKEKFFGVYLEIDYCDTTEDVIYGFSFKSDRKRFYKYACEKINELNIADPAGFDDVLANDMIRCDMVKEDGA